jgi:hypothetical protein
MSSATTNRPVDSATVLLFPDSDALIVSLPPSSLDHRCAEEEVVVDATSETPAVRGSEGGDVWLGA